MRMRWMLTAVALLGSGWLIACGGGKPAEPTTPTSSSAASAAPAGSNTPAPAPAPKSASSEEKPSRSPSDILKDADATWVLAFDQSDEGKKAEEKCTASSKGDEKKQGACMRAARERMPVEAMRFKQDEEAGLLWQFLVQKGGNYTVVAKVPVEFGEETDSSIVIKPKKGKGTGTIPWGAATRDTTLKVPNNFSVVVDDPTHGKTVYEAKIILQQGK